MSPMVDTAPHVHGKSHFVEGGNVIVFVAVPVVTVLVLVFYGPIALVVAGLGIVYLEVYNSIFNLFAVEFGALIALFALFVCRPTPFLERMRNTHAFTAIVTNVKITIVVSVVCILATMILGLLHVEPGLGLSVRSVLFVVWAASSVAVTFIYGRTIRLIFLSLS